MTELYQLKTAASQSEQVIATLREKNDLLERDCESLRSSLAGNNKNTMNNIHNLQESNVELKQHVE